jgi:hypothetical protein
MRTVQKTVPSPLLLGAGAVLTYRYVFFVSDMTTSKLYVRCGCTECTYDYYLLVTGAVKPLLTTPKGAEVVI